MGAAFSLALILSIATTSNDLTFLTLHLAYAPVLRYVTKLGQALLVLIAVVTYQLVTLAYDSFSAQILATAAWAGKSERISLWVVHTCTLYRLAKTVLIALTLRVALKDMIAETIDAASG